MNTQNWVRGTIATVCWFVGSSVPAAPPAASAALAEPAATPAGTAPVAPAAAAESENKRDQLVVLVLTKNSEGEEVPLDDAIVTLFVGEGSQQQRTKDGKTTFLLSVGTQEEAAEQVSVEATLRVAGENIRTQQRKIPSLRDAVGTSQKFLMEKQSAELTDDH
jgi:hypothetical protein